MLGSKVILKKMIYFRLVVAGWFDKSLLRFNVIQVLSKGFNVDRNVNNVSPMAKLEGSFFCIDYKLWSGFLCFCYLCLIRALPRVLCGLSC